VGLGIKEPKPERECKMNKDTKALFELTDLVSFAFDCLSLQ
jgi:hypothetical protein